MARRLISSGSPYEDVVGFSRAVRVGNFVAVGGTAPIGPNGETVGAGDAAVQALRCLEIIAEALHRAGARMQDVVRTRTMLKDVSDWQAVARVRAEFFRDVKPVDTIVEVGGFVDPQWLVEFEVDAIVDDDS